MKFSFEKFNLVFFMAESLAWFEPTKAARFEETSGTFCTLWSRIARFKREFWYLLMFHGRFYILTSGRKKNHKNLRPIWNWFYVEFCYVLSRCNLRKRIRDLVMFHWIAIHLVCYSLLAFQEFCSVLLFFHNSCPEYIWIPLEWSSLRLFSLSILAEKSKVI